MGDFSSILDQLDQSDRIGSVLSALDSGGAGDGWQDVTPVLQRRAKAGGGFEYRPKRAAGNTGPEAVTPSPSAPAPVTRQDRFIAAHGGASPVDRAESALLLSKVKEFPASMVDLAGEAALLPARAAAGMGAAVQPPPGDVYPSSLMRTYDAPDNGGNRSVPNRIAGPPATLPRFTLPGLAGDVRESVREEADRAKETYQDAATAAGRSPLSTALGETATDIGAMALDPLAAYGGASHALETAGQRALRRVLEEGGGEALARRAVAVEGEAALPEIGALRASGRPPVDVEAAASSSVSPAEVLDAMAHGGSDVSPEAMARTAAGNRYYRVTQGGEVRPILADVAAVDAPVAKGEVKVLVTPAGERIPEGRMNAAQARAVEAIDAAPPREPPAGPDVHALEAPPQSEEDALLAQLGVKREPGPPPRAALADEAPPQVAPASPAAPLAEDLPPPRSLRPEPPADFIGPPEQATTGIKNAVTEAERGVRGLPEVEVAARRDMGDELLARGKQLVDSGEIDPRQMARHLAENPEPISAEKSAALVYDRMRLQNEHGAAMEAYDRAAAAGDEGAKLEARTRLAAIEDHINANDVAARRVGYEQGAGLAARRLMIKEDYSVARVLQRARVAADGEVPEAARGKIVAAAKEVQSAIEEEAAHQGGAADRQAARAMQKLQKDAAFEARTARRSSKRVDLAGEFEGLRAQFARRAGTPRMGLDPDLVTIIGKMARNRVQAGVNTLADVVDHIFQAVAPHVEGLTARDVRDAISGYGRAPSSTQGAAERELSRLRQEARLVSKIEDAEAGIVPAPGAPRVPEPEIAALRQKLDEIMRREGLGRYAGAKDPQQVRLDALKKRLAAREQELTDQIASGNFTKKARPPAIVLDPEAVRLRANVERLKAKADAQIAALAAAKQSPYVKGLALVNRWRRGVGALSSVGTDIVKLPAAVVYRLASTPLEEAVGGVISHLPVGKQISALAPRGGGLSLRAEAKSIAAVFSKDTWTDIKSALKTGKTEAEWAFGKPGQTAMGEVGAESALDYFGHVHKAIKTVAMRAEFARSLEKRLVFAARAGKDITHPAVLAEAQGAALVDAERAILQQDNALISWFNNGQSYLRRNGYNTSAAAIDFAFPIRKVPVNFVTEVGSHLGGGAVAAKRLFTVGLKNMGEQDAEFILRNLKKQTLGAALFAAGYAAYEEVGGYYREGNRPRKPGDGPQVGEVRIGPVTIPKSGLHSPAMEILQAGAMYRRVVEAYQTKRGDAVEAARSVGHGMAEEIPFYDTLASGIRDSNSASGMQRMAGGVGTALLPPDLQRAARTWDPKEATTGAQKARQMLTLEHIDATKRHPENVQGDHGALGRFGLGVVNEVKLGIPGLREQVPAVGQSLSRIPEAPPSRAAAVASDYLDTWEGLYGKARKDLAGKTLSHQEVKEAGKSFHLPMRAIYAAIRDEKQAPPPIDLSGWGLPAAWQTPEHKPLGEAILQEWHRRQGGGAAPAPQQMEYDGSGDSYSPIISMLQATGWNPQSGLREHPPGWVNPDIEDRRGEPPPTGYGPRADDWRPTESIVDRRETDAGVQYRPFDSRVTGGKDAAGNPRAYSPYLGPSGIDYNLLAEIEKRKKELALLEEMRRRHRV